MLPGIILPWLSKILSKKKINFLRKKWKIWNFRFYFAASRERQLPSFLSLLHRTQKTPIPALLLNNFVATFLIPIGAINDFINACIFIFWLQTGSGAVVLLWIRYKKIPVHDGAVKVRNWVYYLINLVLDRELFTVVQYVQLIY